MQQQPTRTGSPCPVCGAEPQYRVWSIFMNGSSRIDSIKHQFIKPARKTLRFSARDIRAVPFKAAWEVG